MNFEIIKHYITPERALDIGANIGDWYLELKQNFPKCECLLIEGNPSCEEHLKSLNVSYHICLLGRDNKKITFYRNKTNLISTGNSMYREMTEHFCDKNLDIIELNCHRLDDLNKNNLTFDFVKMDTQGSELDIFSGGINTLTKAKAIVMETALTPYNNGAPLQHEIVKYMKEFNFYNVEVVGEGHLDGQLISQDILFIKK